MWIELLIENIYCDDCRKVLSLAASYLLIRLCKCFGAENMSWSHIASIYSLKKTVAVFFLKPPEILTHRATEMLQLWCCPSTMILSPEKSALLLDSVNVQGCLCIVKIASVGGGVNAVDWQSPCHDIHDNHMMVLQRDSWVDAHLQFFPLCTEPWLHSHHLLYIIHCRGRNAQIQYVFWEHFLQSNRL